MPDRVFTVQIISDNYQDGALSEQKVFESNLTDPLLYADSAVIPNCNVSFEHIFNDKRCRYFQHYMPINQTVPRHSYKKCHDLFKSGNRVKIFISERFV